MFHCKNEWKKMAAKQWITLLLILLTITGVFSHTYKVRSDEEKLLEYLFQDYNPSARPVLNSSHTVNVKLRFSLLQIQELNVRSQVLTTTGLLILDWKDERLTWDPEVTPLDEIVIHGKALWRPEFAVINGAEGIYGDYTNFQANVYPNGSIRWEPGGVFKTMCQIDITYYPFDAQRCDLTFGAWSYYTTKMNLTTDSTNISTDTYESNGEWEITKTSVKRNEFHFECCPNQKFSNVAFTIHIRRRHTFYIMNVILPGILTSAVLLSIFFCTPSQKVHIGVAALLSFRLFLLNVADTIPRTSDHVPLLGIYLTCTMAITTMAMVATVFVLNLYGMKEKPVPFWAKKIFVIYLARILCMCNCMAPQEHKLTDPESQAQSRHLLSDQHNYMVVNHSSGGATKKHHSKDNHESGYLKNYGMAGDTSPTGDRAQASSSLQRRSHYNNSNHSHQEGESHQRHPQPKAKEVRTKLDYNKDWVHVAAVCDRFFFWICLLFITITTLLLFHPLTTSRYFKLPILETKNAEKGG